MQLFAAYMSEDMSTEKDTKKGFSKLLLGRREEVGREEGKERRR